MEDQHVSRRALLTGGGAALAGLSSLPLASRAQASNRGPRAGGFGDFLFEGDSDVRIEAPPELGDEVIPWDDQPDPIPPPAQDIVGQLLVWEELNSRVTPNEKFFTVKHYNLPELNATDWRLGIDGLVDRPGAFTLDDLKARPRRETEFTLECSGNTGLPFFIGGIGNARWAGAQLAPLLARARPRREATEVIFWGADAGTVTIRDNTGVTSRGVTGTVTPDEAGQLDLTITEQFARSMSLDEAMSSDNLLCYEMNSEPLPAEHGAPVRLIAPGWYGVANVKWLTRIQLVDQRFAGRFMARDYVTVREILDNVGNTQWTFNTVSFDRLKSTPAKVTHRDGRHTIIGVAWGAPIAEVEVSIDAGPWVPAALADRPARANRSKGYAWRLWTFDWGTPEPGEHTVASRATDVQGNVQPAADDPWFASRRTYWEDNDQITRVVTIR